MKTLLFIIQSNFIYHIITKYDHIGIKIYIFMTYQGNIGFGEWICVGLHSRGSKIGQLVLLTDGWVVGFGFFVIAFYLKLNLL